MRSVSASLCPSFGGTAVQSNVVYVPCTDGLRAVKIDSDRPHEGAVARRVDDHRLARHRRRPGRGRSTPEPASCTAWTRTTRRSARLGATSVRSPDSRRPALSGQVRPRPDADRLLDRRNVLILSGLSLCVVRRTVQIGVALRARPRHRFGRARARAVPGPGRRSRGDGAGLRAGQRGNRRRRRAARRRPARPGRGRRPRRGRRRRPGRDRPGGAARRRRRRRRARRRHRLLRPVARRRAAWRAARRSPRTVMAAAGVPTAAARVCTTRRARSQPRWTSSVRPTS